MSKRKMPGYEMDDEFIAHLDFLRYDHDNALQTIEQQKQDCTLSEKNRSNGKSFLSHAPCDIFEPSIT